MFLQSLFFRSSFIFLLCSASCFANTLTENTKINNESVLYSADESYGAEVNEWELGIAFGIGGITNPLKHSNNIFLPIVPRISYYGENFFLENTDLGYSFFENTKYSFSLFGRFNEDIRYFPYASTTDIIVTSMGWGLGDHLSPILGSELEPIKVKLGKRHISYLGGIQLHYHDQGYNAKVSILSDVTNTHNGQEVELSLMKSWLTDKWFLEVGGGTLWKSSEVVTYYYGIEPVEVSLSRNEYQPSDSFTHYFKTNFKIPITEKVQFITSIKIERLDSERYNSPLVDERFIYSSFIGFTYDF